MEILGLAAILFVCYWMIKKSHIKINGRRVRKIFDVIFIYGGVLLIVVSGFTADPSILAGIGLGSIISYLVIKWLINYITTEDLSSDVSRD